jgi:hypothetical protein
MGNTATIMGEAADGKGLGGLVETGHVEMRCGGPRIFADISVAPPLQAGQQPAFAHDPVNIKSACSWLHPL